MLLALTVTSLIARSLAATIQSNAECSSDFSWASNSLSQSPCEVAAHLDALCNPGGGWIVPALNATVQYSLPVGLTATACTCSWASYNLISACADCQGYSNDTISWSTYSFNCAGDTNSTTYFPSNLTLVNTLIPYWATTNPANWTNGAFNAAKALSINSEGNPDVNSSSTSTTQSPTTQSSTTQSKPIGAIVGGIVGGVLVLLAAIIVGICLIRRSSRRNRKSDSSLLLMANHTHLRSQSDVAAATNNMLTPNMSTPIGYTSFSSSPMRPTSPTIRTHASSSVRSFPFFTSGGSTILSPSVRQQSPPPVAVNRDETAVEPFTLPPTNTHVYNSDRKQANGAFPVYDPPTAPPTVRMEVRSTTPTPGARTKYNPPAYTEKTKVPPEAGGSSSRQRSPPTVGQVHARKGSADTLHSFTSGGSAPRVGGSNPAISHRVPPPVMNPQFNTPNASASTSVNAITGHGRQPSGNTSSDMDRYRRPATDDGFSVGDIA